MVPFEPDPLPDLAGTPVFIGAGRADPIAPPAETERLADLLRRCGAAVTLHWEPGGHSIGDGEVTAARTWLERVLASAKPGSLRDGARPRRGGSPGKEQGARFGAPSVLPTPSGS